MNPIVIFAGMFAVLSLFVTTQLFSQEDVVKERKSAMKANNRAAKALKGAVKDGNFAIIQKNAKIIVTDMDGFVALFPEGSTAKNSRAKAEIWKNWDDFKSKVNDLKTAASQLANAAESKDLAKVQEQYKAVGSACTSCHRAYRARSKSKK